MVSKRGASLGMPCSSVQTNVEITGEADFARLLQLEEEYVQKICEEIIAVKPDLVITEKGLSGEDRPLIVKTLYCEG